jgi:hypothetical protein
MIVDNNDLSDLVKGFFELDDYKSSLNHFNESRKMLDENGYRMICTRKRNYTESKDKENLLDLAKCFMSLGDYKDSIKYAYECKSLAHRM